MQALKSRVGHAECASGAAGLSRAVMTLSSERVLAVAHLRRINPHVASALAFDSANVSAPSAFSSTRCGKPVGVFAGASAGASAFAFQGTNAHVIVTRVEAASANHRTERPRASVRRATTMDPNASSRLSPLNPLPRRRAARGGRALDASASPDVATRGARIAPFATLVHFATAWLDAAADRDEETSRVTSLTRVAQTSHPAIRGEGETIRVELAADGASVEVSLPFSGGRTIRCLAADVSRVVVRATEEPMDTMDTNRSVASKIDVPPMFHRCSRGRRGAGSSAGERSKVRRRPRRRDVGVRRGSRERRRVRPRGRPASRTRRV